MTQQTTLQWAGFPMGPALRTFLGITPDLYQGHQAESPEQAVTQEFSKFLLSHFESAQALDDEASLIDLLDELVAMDFPEPALALFAANRGVWTGSDFRGQLSIGVSAMLAGELEQAEEHFRAAQALLPKEPAPYVNLVIIMRHEGRHEEAMQWCMAGLDADRNNLRLWDLFGLLQRDIDEDFFGDRVMTVAQERASWAGLSLAADATKTADPFFKLNLLEKLYHQGERDHHFLVELTAAMGVANEYARIPQVVWQAEQMTSAVLPWQLYAHAAQAQLALGKVPECLALIVKARRDKGLPPEAAHALQEMEAEAKSETEEGSASSHNHDHHHDHMHSHPEHSLH